MVRTGKLRKYDYGFLLNKKIYGTWAPPEYDLAQITNPNIILMSGMNDGFADQRDVELLRKKLKVKPLLDYVVPDDKFTHLDFLWAQNASYLVNEVVMDSLNMYA